MPRCCAWLLALFCVGAAMGAAPEPYLYTGTLYHDALSRHQLARLSLIPYVRPGTGSETGNVTLYSAILSLHWGSFSDPEYVALFYENVRYNAQTKEFLLLPSTTSEATSGKLPTVRLRFEAADLISGQYTSPTAGPVGTLRLKRGTEPPPDAKGQPTLTPLAGNYEGNCKGGGTSKARLVTLQIHPTRIPLKEITGAEAALNVLQYLGNAVCDYAGVLGGGPDLLICNAFHGGIHDFYRNELMLTDQVNVGWSCRRLPEDKLECAAPDVPRCVFKREKSERLHSAFEDRREANSPDLAPDNVDVPTSPPSPCGSWEGVYRGVLRHADTGREQYVSLNLTTILVQGPQPPVKCEISGTAELVFGRAAEGRERIHFILPSVAYAPERPEQVIFAEQDSDAILQMTQKSAGIIEGNWYSKLRGFVGAFTAVGDGHSMPALIGAPVPGLSGDYIGNGDPSWTLQITTRPMGPDAKSANPFRQVQVTGLERLTFGPLPLGAVSYDYFTNSFVYETRGRYALGPVTEDGFTLKVVGRTILGISTTDTVLSFRR